MRSSEDSGRDAGASARRLHIEYLLLGPATALFGVVAGSLAADLVTRIMDLPFAFVPAAASAAFGALAVTVVLGACGHVFGPWPKARAAAAKPLGRVANGRPPKPAA